MLSDLGTTELGSQGISVPGQGGRGEERDRNEDCVDVVKTKLDTFLPLLSDHERR